jgi:mono/diheme cytochrome c family protein
VLAISNVAGVILLVLGVIFLIAGIVALVIRGRTRGQEPEIPRAMKPGPSDAALETPRLSTLQGWAVVLVAFFVIWIPVNWLFEPDVNLTQEENLKELAISRGERSVEMFTEENQLGVGCVRCHGPELRGSVIQSGNNFIPTPNLTTVCGGPFTGHPLILSVDDIYTTIEQGRGDPPIMPSWSIRYQGALHDQQINDIVTYIVDMSSEHVDFEDNVCLNPEAAERAAQGETSSSGAQADAASPSPDEAAA